MMGLLTEQVMTLEEFLAFDDGTEASYELENGTLRQMPTESEINCIIKSLLFSLFLQAGIPAIQIRQKTELAVIGIRTSVRIPDLMVLSPELVEVLKGSPRSLVTLDMPPPLLVVEVVSPGQENIDRDYRFKRSQYESRGILEYWIVDPMVQQITVLTWVRGLYEEAVYKGEDAIKSAWVQGLKVEQIFSV